MRREVDGRAGPVVLITGAAGGLGAALVDGFLSAGFRVAAGWHVQPVEPRGEGFRAVCLDVTSGGSVGAGVEAVEAAWGRLDVLVNAAGLASDAPLWRLDPRGWEADLGVNLGGVFRCARAVVEPMSRGGGGHILNIGSLVGCRGGRGQAGYAAAKAGLLGLTQALAAELGPLNIRVNAVLPGFLSTPMTRGLGAADWERIRRANVLGRLGTVAEVVRFLVFLAGMEHVSGQVFALDSRLRAWV